jgi:hypothetical protein
MASATSRAQTVISVCHISMHRHAETNVVTSHSYQWCRGESKEGLTEDARIPPLGHYNTQGQVSEFTPLYNTREQTSCILRHQLRVNIWLFLQVLIEANLNGFPKVQDCMCQSRRNRHKLEAVGYDECCPKCQSVGGKAGCTRRTKGKEGCNFYTPRGPCWHPW